VNVVFVVENANFGIALFGNWHREPAAPHDKCCASEKKRGEGSIEDGVVLVLIQVVYFLYCSLSSVLP